MDSQLWQRKPVEHFEAEMRESKLKRVLGKWGLTSLGVGAIIGAGIFVMTGVGAKEYAGPALALSFVVAGIGCTFAALCYAEFASFLPVEGSAYAYSYATMGELVAWIIGWDLILEYAVGAATVAIAWSEYFNKVLEYVGMHVPYEWSHSPFEVMEGVGGGAHGIMNQDWFVVQGGDGFHCKVDPTDPNIVYGVLQHGVICRLTPRY